jgi:steroid delta-isomerase-like uncharacterized protein
MGTVPLGLQDPVWGEGVEMMRNEIWMQEKLLSRSRKSRRIHTEEDPIMGEENNIVNHRPTDRSDSYIGYHGGYGKNATWALLTTLVLLTALALSACRPQTVLVEKEVTKEVTRVVTEEKVVKATVEARNKELFRKALAALDEGDLDTFRDLLSSDYVCHFAGYPEVSVDRDSTIEMIQAFSPAFPDMTRVIEDLVAEGDKVATRITFQATHRGEFRGIPATGRKVTYSSVHIATIVEGIFKESWVIEDTLGFLRQIGMELRPPAARE